MHWKNNNAIRPIRSSAERVNLPKHHVGPNFINWSPMLCIKKGHSLLQINMEPVANLQIKANRWSMLWKNNNAIRPIRSSAEKVNLPKHHVGPNFINWSPMLCIKKGHSLLQINMEPVAILQINQLELLEIST